MLYLLPAVYCFWGSMLDSHQSHREGYVLEYWHMADLLILQGVKNSEIKMSGNSGSVKVFFSGITAFKSNTSHCSRCSKALYVWRLPFHKSYWCSTIANCRTCLTLRWIYSIVSYFTGNTCHPRSDYHPRRMWISYHWGLIHFPWAFYSNSSNSCITPSVDYKLIHGFKPLQSDFVEYFASLSGV